MSNPPSIEQRQDLTDLIKEYEMDKYKDLILSLAQNTICIKTTIEEDYSKLGSSRIGGWPDLPQSLDWPISSIGMKETLGKKLNFLAQINLSEASRFDINKNLPEKGILYFFIGDQESTDDLEPIVLYAEDTSNLNSTLNLHPIEDFGYSYKQYLSDVKSFKVEFRNKVSLPCYGGFEFGDENIESDDWDKYFNIMDNLFLTKEERKIKELSPKEKLAYHWRSNKKDFTDEDLEEKIKEVEERRKGYSTLDNIINNLVFDGYERSYLLGYGADLNGDLAETVAYYYYGKKITDREILKKFVLLFELDSHFDVGYNWWDAGKIDFVIHEDDLKARDFSKVGANIMTS